MSIVIQSGWRKHSYLQYASLHKECGTYRHVYHMVVTQYLSYIVENYMVIFIAYAGICSSLIMLVSIWVLNCLMK